MLLLVASYLAPRRCESIAAVAAGETVLDAELHRHVAAEIRLHAVRAEIALTTREHDVLALVAQGFSSREIGSRLFVSETTVKTHLANLYGKLGVYSRVQLARRVPDR